MFVTLHVFAIQQTSFHVWVLTSCIYFFVLNSYQCYPAYRGIFDNSCKLMYYQCLYACGVTLITFLAFKKYR